MILKVTLTGGTAFKWIIDSPELRHFGDVLLNVYASSGALVNRTCQINPLVQLLAAF